MLIWVVIVPLRGIWIPLPARKPRFRRCSSVVDVYPLHHNALEPALPSSAFRQSFLATSIIEREQLPNDVRSTLAGVLSGDLRRQQLLFQAMIDTWPRLQKALIRCGLGRASRSQRATAYRTRSRLDPSKVRVSSKRSEPGGRDSNARTPSPTTPAPIMKCSSSTKPAARRSFQRT